VTQLAFTEEQCPLLITTDLSLTKTKNILAEKESNNWEWSSINSAMRPLSLMFFVLLKQQIWLMWNDITPFTSCSNG